MLIIHFKASKRISQSDLKISFYLQTSSFVINYNFRVKLKMSKYNKSPLSKNSDVVLMLASSIVFQKKDDNYKNSFPFETF